MVYTYYVNVTQAQHAAEVPWAGGRPAERDCYGPHACPFPGVIRAGKSYRAKSSRTYQQIEIMFRSTALIYNIDWFDRL